MSLPNSGRKFPYLKKGGGRQAVILPPSQKHPLPRSKSFSCNPRAMNVAFNLPTTSSNPSIPERASQSSSPRSPDRRHLPYQTIRPNTAETVDSGIPEVNLRITPPADFLVEDEGPSTSSSAVELSNVCRRFAELAPVAVENAHRRMEAMSSSEHEPEQADDAQSVLSDFSAPVPSEAIDQPELAFDRESYATDGALATDLDQEEEHEHDQDPPESRTPTPTSRTTSVPESSTTAVSTENSLMSSLANHPQHVRFFPGHFSGNESSSTPMTASSYLRSTIQRETGRLVSRRSKCFGNFGNVDKLELETPVVIPKHRALEEPKMRLEEKRPASFPDFNPTVHSTLLRGHVRDEGGVEKLAGQLIGLLNVLDQGIDIRRQREETLFQIRSKKLAQQEAELEERKRALDAQKAEEQRKLMDVRKNAKLERDKLKMEGMLLEKLQAESKELKDKLAKKSSLEAERRLALDEAKKKFNDLNARYEKERDDRERAANLVMQLQKQLMAERQRNFQLERGMHEELERAAATGNTPFNRPHVNPNAPLPRWNISTRTPLQNVSSRTPFPASNQNRFGQPPPSQQPPRRHSSSCFSGGSSTTPSPVERDAIVIPDADESSNASGSTDNSIYVVNPPAPPTGGQPQPTVNKNVRWGTPIAEAVGSSSSVFNDENSVVSLAHLIPADMEENDRHTTPDVLERISYRSSSKTCVWDKFLKRDCELLTFSDEKFYFLNRRGVLVTIQSMPTVTDGRYMIAFDDISIYAYRNKQLDVLYKNENKTIFMPDHVFYDYVVTDEGDQYCEKFTPTEKKRVLRNRETVFLSPDARTTTPRSDGSYVDVSAWSTAKTVCIVHPKFTLTRRDDPDSGLEGIFNVKVFYPGTDQRDFVQINVCPLDNVLVVKHVTTGPPPECRVRKELAMKTKGCAHLKK